MLPKINLMFFVLLEVQFSSIAFYPEESIKKMFNLE
jgi:hypothetical protein